MTQTHDEQTVERVAKAIFAVDFPTGSNWGRWNEVSGDMRSSYMSCARAALSALPPQEVSVQEAAKVLSNEFTSGDGVVDFKPAWSAFRTALWNKDQSIYFAMSAFLRALSEGKA